jgi:arylsulfatase A-like enzyme
MKRIYSHALTIFSLAFAYTKGTLLSTLLYFIPTYATWMIIGFFTLFLFFIYWITRGESVDFSWKKVLKIASFGTLVGYFLQIINICLYLKIRDIPINIGFFEDEFYRSVVFLLPCLVVGELLYYFMKQSLGRSIGLGVLVLGVCGFQLKNLLTVEPSNNPLTLISSSRLGGTVSKASKDKPNVILILADDLGTGDVSYNGQNTYRTPHIDRLANEGVNFNNAFCSAPICSPSRAGLLTGEYQQRHGFEHLTDGFSGHPYSRKADFAAYGHQLGSDDTYWWQTEVVKRGLDPQTTTLAEFLKGDGYATAAIGKWHLGVLPRYLPQNQGFDYSLCTYSAGMFYLTPKNDSIASFFHADNFFEKLEHQLMVYQLFENGKPYKTDKEVYTTDLFTQKGLDFIEKNKDNRFFLYLPYNAVHGPFQAPKRIYDTLTGIAKHEEKVYAAMVTSLDAAVGQIREKLAELKLDDNTIVIFASDNGAPLYFQAGTNLPLYGGKMSCFEGGLRVPFIFHWKNHIPPTTYTKEVSLMDVFKTVAAAIGKPVPKNIAQDGVNLLPYLWSKDSTQTPHSALFWRVGYAKAIHKGDWKLDWNEKEGFVNLRNLKDDPYEIKDLAKEYPQQVTALKSEFTNWEKQMKPTNWRYSLDAKIEDGRGHRFYFPW